MTATLGPIAEDGHYPKRDAALFRYVLDIPGQYVNDHCVIHDGRSWHLFFIQGVVGVKPGETSNIATNDWARDGNEVLIGHATSADLLSWTLHEPALTVGPAGSLDAGHIYAPYVIEHGGQYWMYYAAAAGRFGTGERMMLATSKDLFEWTRHAKAPLFLPDPSWAHYMEPEGDLVRPAAGRDAHVIRHPEHGFILYYAGALKGDPNRPSDNCEFCCIAAATSPDLIHWQDRGPVLTHRSQGYDTFGYCAPESPCVQLLGERYYLFWKGGSGTRYAISTNPLDFNHRDEYFLATCHASEIFEWDGRWFITSCSRELDDIAHERTDRSKGLYLARIEWDGIWPRVRALD